MKDDVTNGYLRDHAGKKSTGRAMSWVALVTSVLIALASVARPLWTPEGAIVTGDGLYYATVFLVAAFAGKNVQTFLEGRVLPFDKKQPNS